MYLFIKDILIFKSIFKLIFINMISLKISKFKFKFQKTSFYKLIKNISINFFS